MTRSFQKQRGAATVETAISMLIIIPVFTYALFLDDLLRYAADLQEAVVSTPWDFTIQDYTAPDTKGLANAGGTAPVAGGTAVQKNARLMFCDHESSGDSYNQSQDCDGQDHHKGRALSGHVCWLNANAHQIACEPVRTNVGDFGDGAFGKYKGEFSKGGLYYCHGKEVVENYLMPKTFLQEFSKVNLSKENWKSKGDDIHANAQAGDDSTAYYLQQVDFAVVTDPWAINSEDNLAQPAGSTSGPIHDRVQNIYKGNDLGGIAPAAAQAFMAETVAKQLLINPSEDNPTTARISFPAPGTPEINVSQDTGSGGYFASPWRDAAYKNTYNNRGGYYMGCQNPESC